MRPRRKLQGGKLSTELNCGPGVVPQQRAVSLLVQLGKLAIRVLKRSLGGRESTLATGGSKVRGGLLFRTSDVPRRLFH